MKRFIHIFIALLGASSCVRTLVPGEEAPPLDSGAGASPCAPGGCPSTADGGPATVDGGNSAAACLSSGAACGEEGGLTCCQGTRCIEYTVYDWPRCLTPRPDGEFCYKNEQCQSENCIHSRCAAPLLNGFACGSNVECQSQLCENSQCVASACRSSGRGCSTSADCCLGLFCDSYTYGPAKCRPAQPDGASCLDSRECQSRLCQNYQCVSAVCVAVDSACSADGDCCAGLFCDNIEYSYLPPKCTAPRPIGSHCSDNRQCQSQLCQRYECVAVVCGPIGATCSADAECCSGAFCDSDSYGPWQCIGSLPNGFGCSRPVQCQSRNCVNYQCAQ